jgi:enoyl-CoA hydratase
MSSSSVLRVEKSQGVATLTLDRPEAMNALSAELRRALTDAFRELQADGDVRVAIVTGAGRAFCAGMDLKELSETGLDQAGDMDGATVVDAMASFEGPIIGAINGHAITGGFELALACDVLVASTQARFADTHVRIGVLPGWGLSQKLPRLIGISRAKEISLTGNYIDAEQAEAWGLVNRVVAPDELLPSCRALAADMASCPPGMLENYKRLIDEGHGMPFAQAMTHEAVVARESARDATADALATRRQEVQKRGRMQDAS